jgi:hypothetical protein
MMKAYKSLCNDLLVGNFGGGTIEAFDPSTAKDLGKLTLHDGQPFAQRGLWGIGFGNDADNQPTNTLFYAADPSRTMGMFAASTHRRTDRGFRSRLALARDRP